MNIFIGHEIKQTEKIILDNIVDLILKLRGIKEIKEFLNPPDPYLSTLNDLGEFKTGLKKMLRLLEKIKKENKTIVVYTDYDADGITGGAIMWETLHLLGFKVMPYVPDRKKEGYGFSEYGIDAVKKQFDPALIISVDHGITKWKEIAYAKKLGIEVIVTDHHLKSDKPPKDAVAVFHIPALSGSGVSYFVAKEIFSHFSLHSSSLLLLTSHFQNDYLALASIGTVADLVPLVGPSRSIVKHGLAAFPKVKRYGIRHILKEAGIKGKPITPYEIGFIIAPRINAVGRLSHAIEALRLLCTTNESKARELAKTIGEHNKTRQDMVKKSVDEAMKMLQATGYKLQNVIVLTSDSWHEGIIGLIASRLVEAYYRPTLILTKNNGFYKGSARSVSGIDITKLLRSVQKHLVEVGGHPQAAGFKVEEKKLKEFIKAIEKQAEKIDEKLLIKTIKVDIKLPLSLVTLKLAIELEKLEPFGIGNPKPTFMSTVEIVDVKLFGKTNNHLKVFAKEPGSTQQPIEFIQFNSSDQFAKLSKGEAIKIFYKVDINIWDGNEKVRGIISSM